MGVSSEESTLDRIEQLYDVLLQEFDDGGPGAVVRRVAEAEQRECEAVIKYIEGCISNHYVRDALVEGLRRGAHRT